MNLPLHKLETRSAQVVSDFTQIENKVLQS